MGKRVIYRSTGTTDSGVMPSRTSADQGHQEEAVLSRELYRAAKGGQNKQDTAGHRPAVMTMGAELPGW